MGLASEKGEGATEEVAPKTRKVRIRGGRVVNQKRMMKAMAELQAQGMVYVDTLKPRSGQGKGAWNTYQYA